MVTPQSQCPQVTTKTDQSVVTNPLADALIFLIFAL